MGNRQGYLGQGQGRNWQDNNHFAGRDGNVYRKNSGGNWEKHNGGDGWSRGWKGGEHERNLNNYNKARSLGNNPGRYKSKGGGGHKSGGGGGGRRR
jgi:hypothetical protein